MIGNRLLVDPLGDFLVSGLFDHRGEPSLKLRQSPADGVFHAFLFHFMSRIQAAGRADVIMRVLVKAIKAENSLPRVLGTGRRDVESQSFIGAADALSVSDGHAHSGLLDNNRIALRRRRCLLFHQSALLMMIAFLLPELITF